VVQAAYFAAIRTRGGFVMDEVASALQKTIRRGQERQAIFWATELDLTGYGNYAWKRLRIICSEDVGLAWPEGPAVIRALYENWQETRKAEKDRPPERSTAMLFLVHAVCLLARAPKSRVVDNACVVFYTGDRATIGMEIPEYALDHHTVRGRKLGRTQATAYDESYRIENAALEDPYAVQAKAIDTTKNTTP
jgi:replication-associated recombination protein RarA